MSACWNLGAGWLHSHSTILSDIESSRLLLPLLTLLSLALKPPSSALEALFQLMPHRPSSDLSDTTIDTPPLSPSSATRSSVASSNSSFSLGELSFRSSRKFVHDGSMFNGVREGGIQEELDADMERGAYTKDRGWPSPEAHADRTEGTSPPRPQLPRQNSYSKRHASFDTPREVPFPRGYLEYTGGHLPDHSGPPEEVKHEDSSSVPPFPVDSSHRTEPMHNAGGRFLSSSADINVNGDSPPTHRPSVGRSSIASLPLPAFASYFALPSISSSASSPSSDATLTPAVPSSLSTTIFGFSSSLEPLPHTTSLSPPVPKSESSQLFSSSRLTDFSNSIENESNLHEAARSTDVQPPLLPSSSTQDDHPCQSPPTPNFPSSPSSTSSPGLRPMHLPADNTSSTRSQSLSGSSSFPPPEPPTILSPPPPLSDAEAKQRKPYEPFLPRDQLPPDHTYIAVETTPGEYRLIVRLPGFQRDAITLAMRRRRILHVVADNWSDGGGHFERRISFGYDADLASVRAEFDGEVLRIFVPRREPPGWFTQPSQ